jgi:hypothetical protein
MSLLMKRSLSPRREGDYEPSHYWRLPQRHVAGAIWLGVFLAKAMRHKRQGCCFDFRSQLFSLDRSFLLSLWLPAGLLLVSYFADFVSDCADFHLFPLC